MHEGMLHNNKKGASPHHKKGKTLSLAHSGGPQGPPFLCTMSSGGRAAPRSSVVSGLQRSNRHGPQCLQVFGQPYAAAILKVGPHDLQADRQRIDQAHGHGGHG